MLGVVPVPLPQVITGWQRPPCARSVRRNSVKATGAPPSAPWLSAGPTLFSVVVANGPVTDGSAAGHAPTVHPELEPPSVPVVGPPPAPDALPPVPVRAPPVPVRAPPVPVRAPPAPVTPAPPVPLALPPCPLAVMTPVP